ncbi:MmgE/PrpD family protein [Anaerotruncus rubiinfantis]|uniref:MmgE/PrpD family protein n=1 Tax=Anaerotruncus rubiinfantis TaxID=1720200 RepID=UPI0008318E4E|nr:MmgE/PrpD family protein [Anaerotruncus rubiinfantis]RGX56695.1 MmgE/PrpD family protein [Anaerotruncus sp. AF02-27]
MKFSINKITTNYTDTLAQYILDLKYDQLPAEVVDRAKKIALHAIAAALAANGVPMSGRAIELGRQFNGGEQGTATAWISGTRLSMANAAFVNGAITDMLDWEDCSWTGHPSAGVIPSAWACCEGQKKSGKDFITAVVAGYEVYQRIAMAIQNPKGQAAGNGWGLTSWQIFAALVPAIKLFDLDLERANQALGFGTAASTICGCLHHTTMSDAYHYLHGFRARDGIELALTAKSGVENYQDCFDDPKAYAVHMTPDHRPEWYTKELGERYLILDTLLKHWPANMWNQTAVELAYVMTEKYGISPEDIDEIILDPPTQLRMAIRPEGYTSLTQAQFSIPFCIAAMLYDRTPGAQWYSAENMKDPKVLALAQRVKSGPSEQHTLGGSFIIWQNGSYPMKTMTIKTKNGKVYEEQMDTHPGHPQQMMSWEELGSRFRIQSASVLTPAQQDAAISAIEKLEDCGDLSTICHLFARQ